MALPPKKRQLLVSLVPYSDSDEEAEEEDPSLRPSKQATPAKVEATPTPEEEEEWEECPEVIDADERGMEAESRAAAAASGPSPEFWDRRGERAMACSRYPPSIGGTYLRPRKRATAPAEVKEEAAMGGSMHPPSIGGAHPPLAIRIPARAQKNALEEEGGSIGVAARDVINLTPHTVPLVGDKEPISTFAANWQTEDPIIREKIKVLTANYAAFRRVRGDGNCFYRSFMFSYMEHIFETRDTAEIWRISSCIKESMKRWLTSPKIKVHSENFWMLISTAMLRCSREELLWTCRELKISDGREKHYLHGIFRYVISTEMRTREGFFRPFIDLGPGETMDQFYSSVEEMGQECDHIHITALTDALRLPVRVVYLDRTLDQDDSPTLNHLDFFPAAESPKAGSGSTAASGSSQSGRLTIGAIALNPPGNDAVKNRGFDGSSTLASHATDSRRSPVTDLNAPLNPSCPLVPFITLLYRPGHYDILYPR